ncbi:unnamed protein product, partial [Rotaria sordida]
MCAKKLIGNQNEFPILTKNPNQRIKRLFHGKSSKSQSNIEQLLKNNQPNTILSDNRSFSRNHNEKQSKTENKRGYTQQNLVEIKRILSKKENDYYGILNINKDATRDKIVNTYRKLILLVHPDKITAPGATEATQRLNKALVVLLRTFENQNKGHHQQTIKIFTTESFTLNNKENDEVSDLEKKSTLSSTFSTWLFYIMGIIVVILVFKPYVDEDRLALTRYHRMAIFHRMFSLRNKVLPFLHPGAITMDPDSKALYELISLYHPQLDLSESLTKNDVEKFRYHSKRILTALFPAKSSPCLIQHHILQYNTNQINMYYIQHEKIDDWKCSNQPIILYFHGGGFVFGDIDTYSCFECHLSKSLNILVLHVDFRLVPEHSLEETIEDVINIYKILVDADSNIHG